MSLKYVRNMLERQADTPKGGYLCSEPFFYHAYQMVRRMMDRSDQTAYLMLCSIVDENEKPIQDADRLFRLDMRLRDILIQTLRMGDVVTYYQPGKYLVLITNTKPDGCEAIQNRISFHFSDALQRFKVKYQVSPVQHVTK